MSEDAKKYREEMRQKAERLVKTDPRVRVDASDYRPDAPLNADVQTGPRPISRQAFKHGGGVRMVDGIQVRRGDRKPRANGGNAMATPNNLQNRDLKEANELRTGTKHDGGFKKGGSVHADAAEDKKLVREMMHKEGCKCGKCSGGRVGRSHGGEADEGYWSGAGKTASDSHMIRALKDHSVDYLHKNGVLHAVVPTHHPDKGWVDEHVPVGNNVKKLRDVLGYKAGGTVKDGTKLDGELQGTRPTGGRLARKDGGKAGKGKMNVNIIIAAGGKGQQPMPAAPMPMPPGGPVGLRQGVPPPPPMMPPGGAPPGAGMPMARRSGGRTSYEAGAGSGLGRLEKVKNYGGA